ncbi:MAG: MBL fold metallo-hydrolase [Clostridia bacterium]|nr:MBL fold metallo-hydrolase [Clostridia bacterium]
MSDWFTITPIDAHTWAISEYRHWEETHCYLLEGEQHALLIDSGLGICDIAPIIRSLTDRPVTVIATHVHWDHIGSHGSFERMGVHPLEEGWLHRFPVPLTQMRHDLVNGFHDFPAGFDAESFAPFQGDADFLVQDGDLIDLGRRSVMTLHTPGHSPGHLCFYEKDTGYLFTGDLLYLGTLYAFYPSTDPVQFAASVKRLRNLPFSRLFPAHHQLQISANLLATADHAFDTLKMQGKLYQGSGIHDFGEIKIHI